MSTNNNRLGKEIQPDWASDQKESKITKVSGLKLQRMMKNSIGDVTAMSLKERNIEKIEDFSGFSRLLRLDISGNSVKRIGGMSDISRLGMLNASKNCLSGSSSCEDLRYLIELRTLNLGSNPDLKHVESHVFKPLVNLQALVANDCGLSKVSFLKYCPRLNTLVLSRNELTRFPTMDNVTFMQLTKLSLGHNALVALPDLTVCPNLLELRLNNNHITELTDVIKVPTKLKILELSSNQLSSWGNIEILRNLKYLTNLSLKGNPFPPAPATYDDTQLREDTSADRVADEQERRYRHHVLSLFQLRVGALEKPKIQLIVLDMKRVKMKWSHHFNSEGVANSVDASAEEEDAGAIVVSGGRGDGRMESYDQPEVMKKKKPAKPTKTTHREDQKSNVAVARKEKKTDTKKNRVMEPTQSPSRASAISHGDSSTRYTEGLLGRTLESRAELNEQEGPRVAPIGEPTGGRQGGDSGVVAVKIFKKKVSSGGAGGEVAVMSGRGHGGEIQQGKKRKEGVREVKDGTDGVSKKSRKAGTGGDGEVDIFSLLAGASPNSSVFGAGGKSMWN